ncbi:MAG: hypothetical protein WEA59_07365 [Ferruginibacter sp.]
MIKKIIFENNIDDLLFEHLDFGPADKEALLKLLGSQKENYIMTYPYHQILCIKDMELIPIIVQASFEYCNAIPHFNINAFKQSLKQCNNQSFAEVMFITTIYEKKLINELTFIKNKFESISAIDDLLIGSFGYLAFAHQLEQLYCMLTGNNYTEAVSFRKDWNTKRPIARELANNIFVSPNLTLATLLQERCLEENQFVFNANFAGSYQLWSQLIKNSK